MASQCDPLWYTQMRRRGYVFFSVPSALLLSSGPPAVPTTQCCHLESPSPFGRGGGSEAEIGCAWLRISQTPKQENAREWGGKHRLQVVRKTQVGGNSVQVQDVADVGPLPPPVASLPPIQTCPPCHWTREKMGQDEIRETGNPGLAGKTEH